MSFSSSMVAKYLTILTPIVMTITLTILTSTLKLDVSDKTESIFKVITFKDSDIKTEALLKDIASYKEEVTQLRGTLIALKNTSTITPDNIRIETLESKINILESKVNSLNNILGTNPEKNLALPLMRKDIDALGSTIKAASDYSDKQLERFINLFYWIIGVLALGIISIAIALLFGLRKAN
ncbi:TPA: hypothetical protein RQO31_005225 [Klebsiella oxytoca]|nr:hypothetical protein [Klebsiella oxytoca]